MSLLGGDFASSSKRYIVLVMIELATHRVPIAGIASEPDRARRSRVRGALSRTMESATAGNVLIFTVDGLAPIRDRVASRERAAFEVLPSTGVSFAKKSSAHHWGRLEQDEPSVERSRATPTHR